MHTLQTAWIQFSWIDYTLFFGMLGSSVLIGIYFGFFGNKQSTKEEYLLGGRNMKVLPVAISLIASQTSGIALLAVPADIYNYGSNYVAICFAIIIVTILMCYIFVPVFYKLQLTSSYEYLKIRFDTKVRILASFLNTLSNLLYNPIVIYVPALALSQATGINVHYIAPTVCVICIFYTTIGGLKTVVWTDTLQTVVMVASMGIVLIIGIVTVGGFSTVINTSSRGHRLDFDFTLDPTLRSSVWMVVIGGAANWLFHCISPGTTQRLQSVPKITDATRIMVIYCVGLIGIKVACTLTGLIMYARYSECDPLSSQQITRPDQILPHYIMDVAGNIPGLPGLFIAGIFSAALSTLSANLNTVAGTIFEDFVLPFLPKDLTEQKTSNILKLIVIIMGTLCTILVLVVEKMGGIFPLTASIGAITGGPLLGVFSLGMLFPYANAKGALCGGIGSLVLVSWMILGNQFYKAQGALNEPTKPLSTQGCNFLFNATLGTSSMPTVAIEPPFYIYRISFWYYSLIGCILVIVIGLFVSWLTRSKDEAVNPVLISPVINMLLKRFSKPDANSKSYLSVDTALHLVEMNSKGMDIGLSTDNTIKN